MTENTMFIIETFYDNKLKERFCADYNENKAIEHTVEKSVSIAIKDLYFDIYPDNDATTEKFHLIGIATRHKYYYLKVKFLQYYLELIF